MTVSLRNATINLDDFVAGSSVTINVADLPPALEADLNGGWVFFKLSSPVTLLNATDYNIQAKTSNASQVSLWTNQTADNLARCLVTSSATVPTTGDDIIIAGQYTGIGTSSSVVVTMDETRNIDYGSGNLNQSTAAISVCSKSTFTWGTAGATAYNLRVSGNIVVYSSAVMSIGTVGVPIPRTSTATLTLDCIGNVDFGLTVRNSGTFTAQGLSRTVGKDVVSAKLTADANTTPVRSATLMVDTDTGWLANDEIGVSATSRVAAETEKRILANDAVASSMTVTAVFQSTHSGTGYIVAEVVLLTRNVVIRSTSIVSQTYVDIRPTAQFDADWVAFVGMGSATSLKRGINLETTTGSATFDYCLFKDFVVTSSQITMIGANVNNYFFRNCVTYAVYAPFTNAATTGSNWEVSDFIAMASTGATSTVVYFADVGGTMRNITVAGNTSTGYGLTLFEPSTASASNNLTVHSNAGPGINIASIFNSVISTVTSWRNLVNPGINVSNAANLTINNYRAFGNLTSNISFTSGRNVVFSSCTLSGDTTFATGAGLLGFASTGGDVTLANCSLGVVVGSNTAHTNDLNMPANCWSNFHLFNSTLATSAEVTSQASFSPGVTITSTNHDMVVGSHKTLKKEGTLATELGASLSDVVPAVRMTPISSVYKLEGSAFRSAVASGNSLTVTVKVRESIAGDGTDYNGNRARLIVKQNFAVGISSDAVIATATIASEGAYQTLTGVTVPVTSDGVLDFIVDCDGTTGWVNYDTFTVASQADSKAMKFWQDGQPVGYGDNSAGSGGGASSYMFIGQ
jgi:hypothetical protein